MLGENLERIRKEQRYTRKQLAEITGITATNIKLIEGGINDNPRIKTLLSLATALKVPITKLLK